MENQKDDSYSEAGHFQRGEAWQLVMVLACLLLFSARFSSLFNVFYGQRMCCDHKTTEMDQTGTGTENGKRNMHCVGIAVYERLGVCKILILGGCNAPTVLFWHWARGKSKGTLVSLFLNHYRLKCSQKCLVFGHETRLAKTTAALRASPVQPCKPHAAWK